MPTPAFSPDPQPHGSPRVFLAAVGPRMTEVAGEVADGLLVHDFTTERYLRETMLPAFERGLAKSGRGRADVEVTCPAFLVLGTDEQSLRRSEAKVRDSIAFYGSTPAYRRVLEASGWGELHEQLYLLSVRGRWAEMGRLVDDQVLDAFAVRGEPEQLPGRLLARYGDVCDRVSLPPPPAGQAERWEALVDALHGGS